MRSTDPYARLAGLYDRVVEPMMAGVRRVALDVVPPSSHWSVLDVGCGTGNGMVGYVEAGCSVVGVDVSPSMVERAKAKLAGGADIRLIGQGPIPLDAGSFDLVTTSMVLHEVPAAQRLDLVRDMARLTRSGGRILVTDFRFGSLRGWRGPVFRIINRLVERVSGHYDGYLSFKAGGGVPGLLEHTGLEVEREKIVAGGNIALYVISTNDSDHHPQG